MYVIFLRFSAGRDQVGRLMQAHKEWLQRGFDEGVFLMAGSIQPQAGDDSGQWSRSGPA